MELKPQDILHLTSDEYNGFYLIVEITPTFMKIRNPNEEHIIPIRDGIVENVEIVLVHSAIVAGFAETRGFLPEKKIRIEVEFQSDPLYGIIQTLEKDQIEVLLTSGETIYIDFEYKGPPSSILSIVLDGGLEIEYEEMDIFVSESNSRFTLDRQVSDLMDRLLTKQTTKHIQDVNRIVQRFKELRHTFSTPDLQPKWTRDKKYPWVFPIVSLKRNLYPLDVDTDQWVQKIQTLQEKTESYLTIYKQIVQEFQPFVNVRGETVKENKMTFIAKDNICKCYKKECVEKHARLIPQVVTHPYSLLNTPPETIQPKGYLTFSPQYYQYKSPQLPLLQRIHYQSIVPRLRYTDGIKRDTIVLPNLASCVPTFDLFSIHHYLQYLGPYDIQKNDLRKEIELGFYPLERAVQNYKPKKYPSYHSTVLPNYLTMDQVPLHATTEAMAFQLDERTFVDKIDTSKSISPPIVKQYKTVKELKGDKGILFHDKELDRTNYEEMEPYTTIEEMMRYLIKTKRMLPSTASLYAPHFLNQKTRVVNGEYAKVGDQYYKRVQDNWKLDETCSGPYICYAEPECEPPCDDFVFKLKQNTLTSMMQEVKIEYYKTSLERTAYLQKKKDFFTREVERLVILKERQKTMYTDRFQKTAVSHLTQSPYANMLYFILQKPYQERYKELKEFIKQFTRIALKEEDPLWFYCEETDTRLLPLVFDILIDAYEEDTYVSKIEELQKQGQLQIQEDSIVTTVGGFFVAPVDSSSSFDDMVRSTVVEDFFLELTRDTHPNTPLIVELLNETSTVAKVNLTKYYNYMIHELVTETNILVKSIAFVLKLAELLYRTNVDDVISLLIKKQPRFNTILSRFHVESKEFSKKDILNEMKSISSKYGVQMIETKTIKVNKSSFWNTFLPPLHIKNQPPFQKMYELQEHVKKVKPMETTKITSWIGKLPNKTEEPIVPSRRMKTIPFSFAVIQPVILLSTPIILEKIKVQEKKVHIDEEKFRLLIPPLKRELERIIPVELPGNIPLLYLQTFVKNIGRTYPSYISHTITFQEIPLSLSFLSLQHRQKLNDLMKKQIFTELRTFDPQGLGLDKLLQDTEIIEIMEALNGPCNRSQCEYYIFLIFKKYLDYGDRTRTITLLTLYMKTFTSEHKGIYLSYEDIQRKTLKDRATEANQRRVMFNGMDAEKKYTSLFLEETNLTKKAQLGRSRDYIVERYEGNEFVNTEAIGLPDFDPLDLSLVQMGDDNDFGTDGNGDDDYDDNQ